MISAIIWIVSIGIMIGVGVGFLTSPNWWEALFSLFLGPFVILVLIGMAAGDWLKRNNILK